MKFETVLLQSFFAACMLLCLAVMSAMLVMPSPRAVAAASHVPATAVGVAS